MESTVFQKPFLFILSTIVLLSCDNTTVDPASVDRGEAFFPLETQTFREYQVEEIQYQFSGEIIELQYNLREEVVESFLSAQDSTYVIYRYTRNSSDDEWEFLNTWQARQNGFNAIIFEENIPFIKMAFPIETGKFWDGNALNTSDEDRYEMDSLYFSYISPTEQFDSTLTVIQNDNQDFIVELDRRFEVYAFDIGLVYREEINFQYCTNDSCLGQQIIEEGREFRQTLTSYGKF